MLNYFIHTWNRAVISTIKIKLCVKNQAVRTQQRKHKTMYINNVKNGQQENQQNILKQISIVISTMNNANLRDVLLNTIIEAYLTDVLHQTSKQATEQATVKKSTQEPSNKKPIKKQRKRKIYQFVIMTPKTIESEYAKVKKLQHKTTSAINKAKPSYSR